MYRENLGVHRVQYQRLGTDPLLTRGSTVFARFSCYCLFLVPLLLAGSRSCYVHFIDKQTKAEAEVG